MGADMLDTWMVCLFLQFMISRKRKLFIARDRAGKKPLYYYNDAEKIVFASELNCLKGLLPLQMNEDNFYHYLRLGFFLQTTYAL